MGRSVRLLLLAVAAAEPRRRLLVVDFSRSARTDYGLDARHAGPASDARLRLGYVADRGNVRFSAALRRGDGVSRKVAVVADIKRRSPHGGPDNGAQELASYSDCGRVVSDVKAWPVDALCVSLDPEMWGGNDLDLVAASKALNNSAPLLLSLIHI